MAKAPRKTLKLFAGSAINTGQFGSAQAGTKVNSTDLAVIQALPAWAAGWSSAVVGGQKLPALEEMQGVQYVHGYSLAYLFENGMPEWDAGTTYYTTSIVRKTGTYELYGSLVDNNTNNALPSGVSNSNWQYLGLLGNASAPPTIQYLKTGTSATYTRPANCKAIRVIMSGGGGGGGGGTGAAGGDGGDTSFGATIAKGGKAGTGTAGGGNGFVAGTGASTLRITGGRGQSSLYYGGHGGSNSFGGAGMSNDNTTAQAQNNGSPNSGAGGGGGLTTNVGQTGGGGGQAGEYVENFITAPSATYTYTVGAGGNGGIHGGSNFDGGAGGSGIIIVEEFY